MGGDRAAVHPSRRSLGQADLCEPDVRQPLGHVTRHGPPQRLKFGRHDRVRARRHETFDRSAAGLLVGIIAYSGYQFLVHRIDRVVNKMEINAVEFIDLLEEPVKH